MKKRIGIFGSVVIAIFLLLFVYALTPYAKSATILFPSGGGTGVGTLPANKLIVGRGLAPVDSVGTTTLAGNSQIAVTNSPVVIGTSGAVLSIVADSIGDTQLAFNTGQNLTTASSPTFAGATIGSGSGVAKLTAGVVGVGADGTDYTLINALTCSSNDFFSSVTAAGVFTCTTPTGGGGGGSGNVATSTGETAGQLAYWTSTNGTPATLGKTATSSLLASSPLSLSGAGSIIAAADRTLTIANAAADGSTKGAASFTTNDFDASSGNISLDYVNGQKATGSIPGFLTAADWTTFNNKLSTAVTLIGPLGQTADGPTVTLATSSTPFNGLTASTTITGSGDILTFTNTLAGKLGVAGGGTGAATLTGLLVGNGTGAFTAIAGTTCTNQFLRAFVSSGGTCATVGAADVALANLTATNASLTFSGTYDGSTARTIGLNLSNANTWAATQTFQNTGLAVLESSGTPVQTLTIKPGTDFSASRTLTITPGDSDRTITLSGNPTLADWFDQSVKVAASPTFSALTLTNFLTTANGGTGTSTPGIQGQIVMIGPSGTVHTATSTVTISTASNVGVSTTTPSRKFSVGGDVAIGAPTAGGTNGDLYVNKLGTAAGTFLAADPDGKVIATSTPTGTFVGARAIASGATALNTSTYVAVAYAAEDFDSDAFHDTVTNNSRLTVPTGKGGKYVIGGSVSGAASSKSVTVYILLNGTTKIAFNSGGAGLQTQTGASVTTLYNLAVTDYVEMFAIISSADNTTADTRTNLWLYQVH